MGLHYEQELNVVTREKESELSCSKPFCSDMYLYSNVGFLLGTSSNKASPKHQRDVKSNTSVSKSKFPATCTSE